MIELPLPLLIDEVSTRALLLVNDQNSNGSSCCCCVTNLLMMITVAVAAVMMLPLLFCLVAAPSGGSGGPTTVFFCDAQHLTASCTTSSPACFCIESSSSPSPLLHCNNISLLFEENKMKILSIHERSLSLELLIFLISRRDGSRVILLLSI